MLILETEKDLGFCPACGAMLTDHDYFHRDKKPHFGFRCFYCGFSQYFSFEMKE